MTRVNLASVEHCLDEFVPIVLSPLCLVSSAVFKENDEVLS